MPVVLAPAGKALLSKRKAESPKPKAQNLDQIKKSLLHGHLSMFKGREICN